MHLLDNEKKPIFMEMLGVYFLSPMLFPFPHSLSKHVGSIFLPCMPAMVPRCCECKENRPGHFLHSQSLYSNAEKVEQIRKSILHLPVINVVRKNQMLE